MILIILYIEIYFLIFYRKWNCDKCQAEFKRIAQVMSTQEEIQIVIDNLDGQFSIYKFNQQFNLKLTFYSFYSLLQDNFSATIRNGTQILNKLFNVKSGSGNLFPLLYLLSLES